MSSYSHTFGIKILIDSKVEDFTFRVPRGTLLVQILDELKASVGITPSIIATINPSGEVEIIENHYATIDYVIQKFGTEFFAGQASVVSFNYGAYVIDLEVPEAVPFAATFRTACKSFTLKTRDVSIERQDGQIIDQEVFNRPTAFVLNSWGNFYRIIERGIGDALAVTPGFEKLEEVAEEKEKEKEKMVPPPPPTSSPREKRELSRRSKMPEIKESPRSKASFPPDQSAIDELPEQPIDPSLLATESRQERERPSEDVTGGSIDSAATAPFIDESSEFEKKEFAAEGEAAEKPEIESEGISLASALSSEEKVTQRSADIEYFEKMNPQKIFPLIVRIAPSAGQIIYDVKEKTTHIESSFAIKAKADEELLVKIIPVFPGCLVSPNEAIVNLETNRLITVEFHILPLIKGGKITSKVEFWFKDEKVLNVETPAKIVSRFWAKVTGVSGVITGVVPFLLKLFNVDVNEGLAAGMEKILSLQNVSASVFGWLELALLIVLAGVTIGLLFLFKPVRKFLKRRFYPDTFSRIESSQS